MQQSPLRVVVLISGNGSNLQALIDRQNQAGCAYQIVKVISNKADAFGLERAKQYQIETDTIPHQSFDGRENFERALIKSIDQAQPGLVVLAGFMRILTPLFTQHYVGRMLNIHPSLLPKYPGLQTHQRALEAGDKQHGLSIHFVTDELDGGPVILQAHTDIQANDSVETLKARVHQLEHQAYPLAVNLFAQGKLSYQDHQAWWSGLVLTAPLQIEAL
ncbi:MAG: phosphoribosylglycinamide formyltransferase [Thiomicrospira sp.]|uniref:phosphoribosylglycinamide formyltransferase n=1 Tax=Thiomicrospira sp. TaxID=935 RepID=UPI0019E838DA|nr:phosphoribosylglycinamide formyltransferase [Thiomicrospira sp.]MBE0493609.1 phosphoribosylglycinamide formyltransferase [Thiomicrospira sp.]